MQLPSIICNLFVAVILEGSQSFLFPQKTAKPSLTLFALCQSPLPFLHPFCLCTVNTVCPPSFPNRFCHCLLESLLGQILGALTFSPARPFPTPAASMVTWLGRAKFWGEIPAWAPVFQTLPKQTIWKNFSRLFPRRPFTKTAKQLPAISRRLQTSSGPTIQLSAPPATGNARSRLRR